MSTTAALSVTIEMPPQILVSTVFKYLLVNRHLAESSKSSWNEE
jgi:hypothetical protein